MVNYKEYGGKLNNSHTNDLDIGDTILIQYYQNDPVYHIVYSNRIKDNKTNILELPLKKIYVWDAW